MSELSDWKRHVLPGLLAEAKDQGRGEMIAEIERLRALVDDLAREIDFVGGSGWRHETYDLLDRARSTKER